MARRAIAALLCAAMIFSSDSFSMAVKAAPDAAEIQVENEEETAPEEDDGQAAEAAPEEAEQAPEEEAAPAEIVSEETNGEEPASEEITDEVSVPGDGIEAEKEDDGSGPAADQEDPAEDELSEEAAAADAEIACEITEMNEDKDPSGAADPAVPDTLFTVHAETGELQLANAEKIPEDGIVTIPADAKVIPAGIFNAEGIVEKIKDVKFTEDSALETIGENAFAGSKLTKIELPAKVTAIRNAAFKDSALTAVTFPDGLETIGDEAFSGCAGLGRDFVWPAKLKKIGSSAFEGCAFLTLNMTGVTAEEVTIGKDAFKDCEALQQVTALPAGLKTVAPMFAGCDALEKINLPAGVTTLEDSAFENSKIKAITLPEGVTQIGTAVFKRAKELTTVKFEGAVASIGKEAFMGTSVTAIDASHLSEVGQSAFESCSKLTLLKDPGSLAYVGEDAFKGCVAFGVGFVWSEELKSIGPGAFAECGFTTVDLSRVKAADIAIGAGAFTNCKSLTKVAGLPEYLTVVPASMFEGCEKLTAVSLGVNVARIESMAFAKCSAVRSILLPESVNIIKAKAFDECYGLTEITIQNKNPYGDGFIIENEAFPQSGGGCTMYGYEGKVREYAEKNGYTYKTLFVPYSVGYTKNENVVVTLSHSNGEYHAEEEVTVSFKPKQGYTLVEDSVKLVCRNVFPQPEAVLSSVTSTAILYKFIMPEGNVQIEFGVVKTENAVSGKIKTSLDPLLASDAAGYHFDKAGQRSQISVTDNEDKPIGAWLLDFKSSNSKIVAVDSKGLMLSKGKGTVTVTVARKGDATNAAAMKVVVDADTAISDVILNPINAKRAFVTTENVGDDEYAVVQYDKSSLKDEPGIFEVSFNAYDDAEPRRNYLVSSEWNSTDTKIATVEKKNSETNTNKITVKAGAAGECKITVSVLNKSTNKKIFRGIIIRSIDATPRLAESKITVNAASTVGTPMTIIPVYGCEIVQEIELKVVKKNSGGGYSLLDELAAEFNAEDHRYYLKSTGNFTAPAEYKGKLYLQGTFKNGERFWIPIPTVSVVKKNPNPTVKVSGKVNLFFSGQRDNVDGAKLTQSLKDEVIEPIELLSVEHYNNDKSHFVTKFDGFSNNFEVVPVDNKTFKIVRTANAIALDDKGKPIVSGYVAIRYAGYAEPVYKKIKVSTEEKKPAYELSVASAAEYAGSSDVTYRLQILDKKTKQAIDLSRANILNLDQTSTAGLFREIAPASVEADEDGRLTVIPLTVNGGVKDGQAVINLQLSTWKSYMQFKFSLQATSSLPKADLSSKVITLNTNCPGMVAKAALKLDLKAYQKSMITAELAPSGLAYVADGSSGSGEAAIRSNITFSGDTMLVQLPANASEGTYNYTLTPYVRYGAASAEPIPLAPIAFKVVVTNTEPSATVSVKGTLNPVDPYSYVTCTAAIRNADCAIESVSVYENDPNGNIPYIGENGQRISKHFEVIDFDPDTNQVFVGAKYGDPMDKSDEDAIVKNVTYKVVLCYKLKSYDNEIEVPVSIKPKQKISKMKAVVMNSYVYVGQKREDRTIQVQLATTGKDGKYAQFAAPMPVTKKNNATDEMLHKAFRVKGVDPETGIITLELVDPTNIVLGKKYTLTFENRYLGQMKNTKGSTFKVSVTVRK